MNSNDLDPDVRQMHDKAADFVDLFAELMTIGRFEAACDAAHEAICHLRCAGLLRLQTPRLTDN